MKALKISLFVFLLFTFFSSNAEKEFDWNNDFLKAEADYIKGDYKRALSKSQALLKKVENKFGNETLSRAVVLAQIAKIYEALSKFDEYKTNIDLSVNTITLAPKVNNDEYAKTLVYVTETYIQYGDIVNAQLLIEKALVLISEGKIADPIIINEVKSKQALVYFKQGFTIKAEAMMPELISFKKSRVVKKEPYTDSKGRAKEKKISSTEVSSRARSAADLMNLYSLITLENGNYSKTDSILNQSANYVKKNASKKDVAFVENIFQRGLLLEAQGQVREANDKFEKAAKKSVATKGIRWKPMSKQVIRIQEQRIVSHRMAKRDKQAKKRAKILETRVRRAYGINSIYYARVKLIEAEKYLISKDYKKAEERVLAVLNNPLYFPKNNPQRIQALNMWYTVNMNLDKFTKSEESLGEVVAITKVLNGSKSPNYYGANLDLANFHVLYSSKFKEAEELYSSYFDKIKNEVDHRSKYFLSYVYNYSVLFEYTDRFDKALELINMALKDTKKYYGESSPKHAIALEREANIFIDLGKYVEAEKNLNTAENIFKEEATKGDYEDYSHALETFARLYIIQGQYDDARKILKKAMQKQSIVGGEVKMSGAIEELATLYIETGKYQETEKSLKQSLKLKEAKYGSVHRTLVNPLNQLGYLYLVTGNYIEAEKNTQRAASISGQIYGESSLKYAESLKLQGNIYASIGDYEKAEEAIDKALQIQKHQYKGKHLQIAMSINDIALIKYYNNTSAQEVESLFLEALNMAKEILGDKHPSYASILQNVASFYLASGNIDKAEKFLNQANAIWIEKFGESNRHSAEIYFAKGNVSYKKANYLQAKKDFTQSKNIYQRVFDNANHPGYLSAVSKMGQMDFINGDYKGAVRNLDETTSSYLEYIQKYFPSLSEREKTKFWSKIQEDFEFYNTLAIKITDNPELVAKIYNFSLSTKALLLNSSIKVRQRIMDSKDSELIGKFEQWISKKEFLTSAISLTSEQRKESGIDLKVLESEIEFLEKELSSKSELFAQNFQKKQAYNWENVRNSLSENESAIEIIRFRSFDKSFTDTIVYAALIVTPSVKSYPKVILLKNGKQLEEKSLNYYRNCMKFNIEDKQSYNDFWKPIKDNIKDNTVVYFSPEGIYNQINIESLSEDKKYVLDQNEIVLVSSTRDLIARKIELERLSALKKSKSSKSDKNRIEQSSEKSVALFGNPVYYSDSFSANNGISDATSTRKVPQLIGAEKETRELNEILTKSGWKSEAYLNDQATEAKLKELKNVKVLHIATHGFFMNDVNLPTDNEGINKNRAVQNPLHRSGLLLKDGGHLMETGNVYEFNSSDGILTAYEAMNLNFDNTELIVLSACETGLGKVQLGEGVYGLQRSFLVAGSKTVIMSLFKVSDEVTQELMTTFYKNWIATGDKRQSFIDAKKSIKAEYDRPIYWGAFIMIGLD